MIVVRAPLRLSLGGGGSDLPWYASRFGGSMVSIAINKYIYIIVQPREFYNEFLIRYSKTEVVKNIEDIQHTRIRAALQFLNIKEPLEITALADVPAGTGLGSSSTFTVALLKALHTHKREDVSAKTLAEEACQIEIEMLKEPIGKQDQYVASYGGLLHLEFKRTGQAVVSPLNASRTTLEELEHNTLLFSTDIKHSAVEVIKEQQKNAESDEAKMDCMHTIKSIGADVRKALESGNVLKFGQLLNLHWEAKRKFGEQMSADFIDKGYERGIQNGAIGGKLVGAGGGGFLLFYTENKKRLREAMQNAGYKELPFKFDTDGCKVIFEAS